MAFKKKFTYRIKKKNPVSHFSLRESPPKPEIVLPNLDFHRCFCSNRLFYPKRHLEENNYMLFEENRSSSFFETRTSEIRLPNLELNEFSCGKRLIHSE